MKIKLSSTKIDEEKELEFPLLMVDGCQAESVYLITEKTKYGYLGTRLSSGIDSPIGEHYNTWTNLSPYDGSITLSN